MDIDGIERMLHDLGELLGTRGYRFHVAVIGGTALLLHEVVSRTTRDVDVVGVEEAGQWVALDGLPEELAAAAQDIALLHSEDADWFNAKPSDLLKVGLPHGWTERLTRREYGTGLSPKFADQLRQALAWLRSRLS